MDTQLRTLEAEVAPPTKDVLAAAFDALDLQMSAAELGVARHLPRRRRRRLRVTGLVAAGAVALVATLVLTDVVGIAGIRGGASAQAAEVLDRAAATTIRTTDPVLVAGQLLQVASRSVHYTDANGFLYAIHEDRTDWIPKDQDDSWTEVRFPGSYAGQAVDAAADRAARRDYAEHPETTQVLHAKRGAFFGSVPQWNARSVADLPRDPRILLNRVYRLTLGTGSSPDGEALVFLGDLLRSGVVPADLRATVYRAAAMIPGVTVTDGATSLDGRRGVAIGRVERTTGIRYDLVIDPDTGLLIGEREVATRAIDPFAAGTVLSWSSVEATVVDAVPAAYR